MIPGWVARTDASNHRARAPPTPGEGADDGAHGAAACDLLEPAAAPQH